MPEADAYLLVAAPSGDRRIPLEQQAAWMIGRSEQHPVVIEDDSVSRTHALIQCNNFGEYYLMDMGSRNGSWVNGARVSVPQLLKNKDQIGIGSATLTFFRRDEDSSQLSAASRAQKKAEALTSYNFLPKMITVLVIDIRDYTGLAQQIDNAVLCELIGAWFQHGGTVMKQNGCWAQKYIGDAIMSVWLHANLRPQATEMTSVLNAYIEMVKVTQEVGSRFSLPHPLTIGAGINTGLASVGNTGGHGLADFTALGASVNAAFRIESATRQIDADLAIGQGTFDALQSVGDPALFRPHQLMLKGYNEPTPVWSADVESVRRFLSGSC